MSWGTKQIQGVVYDLTHLDDFFLEVTPKVPGARTYKVRVSFGHHTFTRDLKSDDKPDLHFHHRDEVRCFCHERYKLSTELRDMISYAANGRAYFSEREKFLVVESPAGTNAPYVAFFNVQKAKKVDGFDAALFVTSAYIKEALPPKLPAVTFATLIDYTVQNKKLSRPESRRVIIVKRK